MNSSQKATVVYINIMMCCAMSLAYAVPCWAEAEADAWWLTRPMRMIQTNLREIDATLDIDTYVQQIKSCKANVVLFNVGGIVANYPTELPYQYRNPRLTRDLVGDVVKRLHSEGIRVIGRFDFSKINEQLAAEKPEWLYKSIKGQNINYNGQVHTCINGGYQQEYLFKILGEAIDRYPLDGVFFNMIGYVTYDYSGNYHGICQCDSCRKRFADWSSGLDLPRAEDTSDPVFRKYDQFRRETSDGLFHRVNKFIRSKRRNIAVCTYTAAGVDIIRYESNTALDRPLPIWNYSASDNVKRCLGSYKDKVISNTAVHFIDFPYRHSAVSPYLNELRLAQNIANGGWADYYMIGRLENQEDRLGLDIMRSVFGFHAKNEKWFTNTKSVADVCLIRAGGAEYTGLFRILAENHILFDVIENAALAQGDTPKALEDYQLVILPDVRNLSDTICNRLDAYVVNGGKLLVTGMTSTSDEHGNPLNAIRLKAAGVKPTYKLQPHTRGTYFRIRPQDKKELAVSDLDMLDIAYLDSDFLICEPTGKTESLLGFIPEAMYGPPEKCYYTKVTNIPGLLHARFGKGRCAFFPWLIGSHYQRRSNHVHSLLVMGALEGLLGLERSVVIEASPLVEVTRHASSDGRFEWVGLINHTGQNGTAFHKPIPMSTIPLQLKTEKYMKNIRLLNAERRLDFPAAQAGWVKCVVPELQRFEIVLYEYE